MERRTGRAARAARTGAAAALIALAIGAAAEASDARFTAKRAAPGAQPERVYLAPAIDPSKSAAAPRAPHLAPAPTLKGATARPRPALWRLADHDSVVWIFGSVHALPEGLAWRRPELLKAFRRADVYYFETDMTAAGAREMARAGQEGAVVTTGAPLSAKLSDDARARLDRLADAHGFDPKVFDRMRPWAAAMAIGAVVKAGTRVEHGRGVDAQLLAAAIQTGKEIRAFKSARDQIAVLTAMPEPDQIAFFETSLAEVEASLATEDNVLLAAWLAGDLAALERRIFEGPLAMPPGVRERMLDERNVYWALAIERFLDNEAGVALVIGGAAHFAGPGNVIELLRSKGRRVQRY